MGNCCEAEEAKFTLEQKYKRISKSMLNNGKVDKKWSKTYSGQVFWAICKLTYVPKSYQKLVRRVQNDLVPMYVGTPKGYNPINDKLFRAIQANPLPKVSKFAIECLAESAF